MTAGMVSMPRTPVEQLLLTQSLVRSLDDMAFPFHPGDSIDVEIAWPPTHDDFKEDRTFAQAVVTSWFVRHGAIVGREHPSYRVRVLLHAFGLEKSDTFVGIPPIQSLMLPLALPELTVYRNVRNRGYTRLSVDITEESTGRLVASPAPVEAKVRHERFTLLFVLSWTSTDLLPPPL